MEVVKGCQRGLKVVGGCLGGECIERRCKRTCEVSGRVIFGMHPLYNEWYFKESCKKVPGRVISEDVSSFTCRF